MTLLYSSQHMSKSPGWLLRFGGLLVIFLGLLGSAERAAALGCTVLAGSVGVTRITLPSTLTVPRDAFLGSDTVLWESSVPLANSAYLQSCSGQGGGTSLIAVINTPGISGRPDLLVTGVPGLGLRVFWDSTTVRFIPFHATQSLNLGTGISAGGYAYCNDAAPCVNQAGDMGTIRTQLVAYGPVTPGGTSIPLNANTGYITYYDTNSGTLPSFFIQFTGSRPTITTQTCAVQTPSVTVDMPGARASSLPTVGSTVGSTQFPIKLHCPSPDPNLASGLGLVDVTFTDPQNPTGGSNILPLTTGTASAQGVGYQLLMSDGVTPITFGRDSAAAGNPGQFTLFRNTGLGDYEATFTARYIRTSSAPIVPGEAKAVATFTMSYQ